MTPVRRKETQAQAVAHLFDDVVRIPGTSFRFGLDPIVGLLPLWGDALVTAAGVVILIIGIQLGASFRALGQMTLNLLINGVSGAIPGFGDLASCWIRSHNKNAALLIRSVREGEEGSCPVAPPPLGVSHIVHGLAWGAPVVAVVAYVSAWLWQWGVTIF